MKSATEKPKKEVSSYVKKYYVMKEALHVPSGLFYGRLLRRNAERARRSIQIIITRKMSSNSTACIVVETARRLKLI